MKQSNRKKRVVVAMSGGVDSSVAAYILKKKGYDVIGIFLKFWQPPNGILGKKKENTCCDLDSLYRARKVCEKLDIPFYTIDVQKDFKKKIVDYYIGEYEKGRTPNPCVKCNRFIKFGLLWEKAKGFDADFLSTGHYIQVKSSKLKSRKFKEYGLYRPVDKKKDQTYFLWSINKNIVPKLMFPLGRMKKDQVRFIAKEAGLGVHSKGDSQGICFIPDGNNQGFLSCFTKKLNQPGDIVDKKGNVLGKHDGLAFYTVGQREGLGNSIVSKWNKFQISNFKFQKSNLPPLYVVRLDVEKNHLVVGINKDIFGKELVVKEINVLDKKLEKLGGKKVWAQIRGGHLAQKCLIKHTYRKDGKISKMEIVFDKKIRAITSGQSIVFYGIYNKKMLGGGVIR